MTDDEIMALGEAHEEILELQKANGYLGQAAARDAVQIAHLTRLLTESTDLLVEADKQFELAGCSEKVHPRSAIRSFFAKVILVEMSNLIQHKDL